MYRKGAGENSRHRMGVPHLNQGMTSILKEIATETKDNTLAQSKIGRASCRERV